MKYKTVEEIPIPQNMEEWRELLGELIIMLEGFNRLLEESLF